MKPVASASKKLSDAVLDCVKDLTAESFSSPQATAVARGVCAVAEVIAEDTKKEVNNTVTALGVELKAKIDVADANVQSRFEKFKLWQVIIIIGFLFVAVPMDNLVNGTAGKLLSWGLSFFLKGG